MENRKVKLLVLILALTCSTAYAEENLTEKILMSTQAREKDSIKEEVLRQFPPQDQIRLLAMIKYIDHSLFQHSLKRKAFVPTMNIIELDLMLYYKEYLKTNESSIDNFIEYLRLNVKKGYANVDTEEVIIELKMKLNSLCEEYTKIYKKKIKDKVKEIWSRVIMPVDVIK